MIARVFFLIICFSVTATAQLTIIVEEIPMSTPALAEIYIAGNFQGWNPQDEDYKLTKQKDGNYSITINPDVKNLEFKFTRGSWERTEGNANGQFLPNRTFSYSGEVTTITLSIAGWEDIENTANSTAASNVRILDDEFPINTLNRKRRIWIYFPPDYETSDKVYPVLYLQDGQNVFDASTSFSGEWEVDETLNRLFGQGDYGCIVVAIDNGGQHRIDEYSPWVNTRYGGGDGDEYMGFIVNELKPVIDANFRTLKEREFTGILGSSMGGLISHYGFIEYPTIFGKAGIFSPSYWFSEGVYEHTDALEKKEAAKIYLLAGQNESATLVSKLNRMENLLKKEGFTSSEIRKVIHADGAHSEWYWKREFGAAYQWLFGDLNFTTATVEAIPINIKIYPNPADSLIRIEGWEMLSNPSLEIVSMKGKVLRKQVLKQDTIPLERVPRGVYLLKIWEGKRVVFSDKLIKK